MKKLLLAASCWAILLAARCDSSAPKQAAPSGTGTSPAPPAQAAEPDTLQRDATAQPQALPKPQPAKPAQTTKQGQPASTSSKTSPNAAPNQSELDSLKRAKYKAKKN